MKKLSFLFLLAILCWSCEDDDNDTKEYSVSEISNLIRAEQFKYYKEEALQGKGAHVKFIKVKFNETAASVLDENNRLIAGKIFPRGSLIVKEIMETEISAPHQYSIMYKQPDDPNANKSWLWAELKPDESVVYDLKEKGTMCMTCHTAAVDMDYALVFDNHQ